MLPCKVCLSNVLDSQLAWISPSAWLLPQVRELELNMDIKSVNNLLEFLEKVFNGGSGEPEQKKKMKPFTWC